LKINKGVTAIVGGSGNGKSTLLNMVMKFYEPMNGEIILHTANKRYNLQ
jgi:ATP-binding cassette subfamily B protein